MASDEETAALSLSDEGAFVKSTWEVTWTDPNGLVRHFPVYRTVLKVPPVHFTMVKGQLHFESAEERSASPIRSIRAYGRWIRS